MPPQQMQNSSMWVSTATVRWITRITPEGSHWRHGLTTGEQEVEGTSSVWPPGNLSRTGQGMPQREPIAPVAIPCTTAISPLRQEGTRGAIATDVGNPVAVVVLPGKPTGWPTATCLPEPRESRCAGHGPSCCSCSSARPQASGESWNVVCGISSTGRSAVTAAQGPERSRGRMQGYFGTSF